VEWRDGFGERTMNQQGQMGAQQGDEQQSQQMGQSTPQPKQQGQSTPKPQAQFRDWAAI
jgi:hypothetical protein